MGRRAKKPLCVSTFFFLLQKKKSAPRFLSAIYNFWNQKSLDFLFSFQQGNFHQTENMFFLDFESMNQKMNLTFTVETLLLFLFLF